MIFAIFKRSRIRQTPAPHLHADSWLFLVEHRVNRFCKGTVGEAR